MIPDDLPALWQKPPANILPDTLRSLARAPPTWNPDESPRASHKDEKVEDKRAVSTFLANIVKSALAWIDDDDIKEEIWEEASRRISERAGRSALGEMTRTWPLPALNPPINLTIHEPAMTGDQGIGMKTWGSSYLLALSLPALAADPLSEMLASNRDPRPRVLELGAGTGLLGLAAAATWGVSVALSDLAGVVPNLRKNVDANRQVVEECGGEVDVGVLEWGGEFDEHLFSKTQQFEIVLAADPLYDDEHPALLASAISSHLSTDTDARAVVMVPKRDPTTVGLLATFKECMISGDNAAFACVKEGELDERDDWGRNHDDDDEDPVKCWWAVFRRV